MITFNIYIYIFGAHYPSKGKLALVESTSVG